MDANFLNIVVLFGAIQGFTLCLYLYPQKVESPLAYRFFLLFIFSLAFFNLRYALLYMQINQIGFIPLTAFPFPYKYLIGVGFYFYIKNHLSDKDRIPFHKKESYLFIPAVLYGILRSYWYVIEISDPNQQLFFQVFQSGFFTYNEFVYLTFDLLLIIAALRFLNKQEDQLHPSAKNLKDWKWLKTFARTFLGFTILNLIHITIAVLFNLENNRAFYSGLLLLNSVFIYWIGFIGFTKSSTLFKTFKLKKELPLDHRIESIKEKLQYSIEVEEVYKNPNLKIIDLAQQLNISAKELSSIINEAYQMNFSQYINHHRVESIKVLLKSPEEKRYTLLYLAEKSGFSSKSSFNATFKKMTGFTPKQYQQMD